MVSLQTQPDMGNPKVQLYRIKTYRGAWVHLHDKSSLRQVRASVPFSPWDTEETTVCLTIAGSQVLDVYGNNFPAKQACTTLNHRSCLSLSSTRSCVCYASVWDLHMISMMSAHVGQ